MGNSLILELARIETGECFQYFSMHEWEFVWDKLGWMSGSNCCCLVKLWLLFPAYMAMHGSWTLHLSWFFFPLVWILPYPTPKKCLGKTTISLLLCNYLAKFPRCQLFYCQDMIFGHFLGACLCALIKYSLTLELTGKQNTYFSALNFHDCRCHFRYLINSVLLEPIGILFSILRFYEISIVLIQNWILLLLIMLIF